MKLLYFVSVLLQTLRLPIFLTILGQERTQKMNRMYYQGAHACVIMFDLTYEKSLDISLKWKEDLDSKCTLENGDPIPCILLAN